MRPIAGKLRPHMRRDRNHPTNLPAGAVYRALRSGCDMARPRIDKRAYFYRAMTKADVRKFAVVCTATVLRFCQRVGECREAMKSAMRGSTVPVRKADPVADAKALPALTLLIAAMPKNLAIQGPVTTPVAPRPFSEFLDMELKTANILKGLTGLFGDGQRLPDTPPIPLIVPRAIDPASTDYLRYFDQARGFFSQVQAYRHRTGDTDLAGTPASAEQVTACLAELKKNDAAFQQYAYYLSHPNNKPNAINAKANVDFVEAGILSSMVPKGLRVNSNRIYSAEFCDALIAKFLREGCNVIVRADTFLRILCKFGFVGRPTPSPDVPHGDGELFSTEDAAINEIFARLGPDATEEEKSRTAEIVFGFNAGGLNATLVHIKIPPKAIKNPRIASGNEHGATHLWLFGAAIPMGHLELISDRVSLSGIPGTDPKETAPTVRILGPRGKDILVTYDNYLDIRDRLLAFEISDAKELHKGL